MDSPVLPLYLARIQRINRCHVCWSMVLKTSLDTPCRK
jgi:alkylhydroperoxidase family enzyme